MTAGCSHSRLGSVTVDLVAHARRLARLRIYDLHVGDVDPRFLLYDSAAAISRGLLVSLDHSRTFDLHFSARRSNCQDPAPLSLVAAGHQDYLVVLSDLRSLRCSQFLYLRRKSTTCATSNDLRRQRNNFHVILVAQLARNRAEDARANW